MDAFSDVAPSDKVDQTPMDEAIRALLGALASVRNPKPTVTLLLGPEEWARARVYYQRPYQKKPSREFAVYLQEGTVWFEKAEPKLVGATGHTLTIEEAAALVPVRDLSPAEVLEITGPNDRPASTTFRMAGLTPDEPAAVDDARAGLVDHGVTVKAPVTTGTEATYGGVWTAPEERE